MTRVLISIVSMDNLEAVRACIEAVMRHCDDADLVLTNQASTDGTREFFDKLAASYGNVTVFHEESNTGYQAPHDRAYKLALDRGIERLIILNDDTVPPPGFADQLLAALDQPNTVLAGPRNACCSLHDNFDGYPGDNFEYVEGSCLAINVPLLHAHFGRDLWCPHVHFIYGEDSSLSLRCRERGLAIARVDFDLPHTRCQTTRRPEVKELCRKHQLENHEANLHRWAFYLKHRHFNYPLVVKRDYAIGDVLLTTPIIAGMKAAYRDREIWVQTDFPQVFDNNPHVSRAGDNLEIDDAFPILDLNSAYEKRPVTGIMEAYHDVKAPWKPAYSEDGQHPRLYPSDADRAWAGDLARAHNFSPNVCVIHADHGHWPGKNWPQDRFAAVATWLVRAGWHVVAVGTKPLPPGFDALDLTNWTSVLQLAALLARSQLFLGGDSFPMHASLAMRCPTVALFGVTSSKYIVHGSGPQVCLDATIGAAGARHRLTHVEHTDLGADAIQSHTVDDVQRAIRSLVNV